MSSCRTFLVVLITIATLSGCSDSTPEKTAKKEMLIYCGITMINPMKEIADIFERTHNCKINLTQGGSEDLYQSLKFSKIGELYLPGSQHYRNKHLSEGFLKDYVEVGYNQAALIVQKGNPKNIPADITMLAAPNYATVIGDAESCSIGKQSEKILTKLGIYDQVVNNTVKIAADSRTMNKTIIDKTADLILNWGATAYFKENRNYMERLQLDEAIAPKNRLQLSLLSFARYPELAVQFMDLAVSPTGKKIFQRYGFLDRVHPEPSRSNE
jgi:molybdate transport system substrate-binding protein